MVELDRALTVVEAGATDFEDIELYDLRSGLLLDRHAGTPMTGMSMTLHNGEAVSFDVVLHDELGQSAGAPIHIETRWGPTFEAGSDSRDKWERTQRQAALLEEQRRLLHSGRLFFYSGGAGERERALRDVRQLIRMHAKRTLWVWDPYFGGRDALEFLPHVLDPSIEVRVLTSLTRIDGSTRKLAEGQLREAVTALGLPRGRGPGMTNVEVGVGSGFHDRFLITDVACWQLGASFNQLGNVYSTIVEFPYADLVVQAFARVWKVAESLCKSS
jgi:hypothetical protein